MLIWDGFVFMVTFLNALFLIHSLMSSISSGYLFQQNKCKLQNYRIFEKRERNLNSFLGPSWTHLLLSVRRLSTALDTKTLGQLRNFSGIKKKCGTPACQLSRKRLKKLLFKHFMSFLRNSLRILLVKGLYASAMPSLALHCWMMWASSPYQQCTTIRC